MSVHNFDLKIKTPNFEIVIDTQDQYGYFEHETLGDDYGGSLWFDGKELIDHDSVFQLPEEVTLALRNAGLVVSEEFE